jgi:hypothetical protein
MKRLTTYSIFFAGVVLCISSCKKEQLFPDEPMLTFKEYQYNGSDTLNTVFYFTDGDGDIGVAPDGNAANMWLTLYYKDQNGQFRVALYPASADTIKYPYRIPELPDGQNGVEGDIHLVVNSALIPYDTIQFSAFLVDQANHQSAVIRTPQFGLR